jgi:hypothetical protein
MISKRSVLSVISEIHQEDVNFVIVCERNDERVTLVLMFIAKQIRLDVDCDKILSKYLFDK